MAVSAQRAQLLVDLEATQRKVGAQSVLLSDTVARIVGLNSTRSWSVIPRVISWISRGRRPQDILPLTPGSRRAR